MSNNLTTQTLGADLAPARNLFGVLEFKFPGKLLAGPLAALVFWSLQLGLEPLQQKALAITVFMLISWITSPIDHGLTALIGCYLFWALGVTKFAIAFSGFTNSTIWFLFCSLLMAEAVSRTGLAKRVGYLFMRGMGASCARLQTGIVVLTFLLALLMPSGMGPLSILAPLTLGLVKVAGLKDRGNFTRGLLVMITTICALMSVMVLSGATSMMTRSIVEEQTGIQILWSQWLFACLPLNLLTMIATLAIVRWLYPAEIRQLDGGREYIEKALEEMGPWTTEEKKTLFWFVLAVSLWATDSLHHINPAVIGIGAGLALSLPAVGVLDIKATRHVNFFVIIFSAGALGMGAVLMDSGVLPLLVTHLVGLLQPFFKNALVYTCSLYVAAFAYHFIFANRQTMLATSLPLLLQFANTHGMSVVPLALLWTIGGGGGLFVYQSGVYVLGYSYGCFSAKDFLKVGLLLTIVQGIGLALLVPYYWPLIGLNWMK
ncbi:MAG TPA: SLC13 family permease [Candidatus Binatia bacterium]